MSNQTQTNQVQADGPYSVLDVAASIPDPTSIEYWFNVFDKAEDRAEYGAAIRDLNLTDEQNALFVKISEASQNISREKYDDNKLVEILVGGLQNAGSLFELAAFDGVRNEVIRRGENKRRPQDN